MTTGLATTFIEMIQSGQLDRDLAEIRAELTLRAQATGLEPVAAVPSIPITGFAIGQRVAVTRHIRPAYLTGMKGQIVGKAQTRFKVRLDPEFSVEAKRYIDPRDGTIRLLPNQLEKTL